jgi:peptidoglycan/LPS O-acetylase OafA/YrhL
MNRDFSSRHVAALDGLRGCAALAVTFFHGILHFNVGLIESVLYAPAIAMTSWSDGLNKVLLAIFNGDSAVMLFFVLSGYVLSGSIDRSLNKGGSAWIASADFLIKRFTRIYPALIGCMILYWVIFLVVGSKITYPAVNFEIFWKSATLYEPTIHGPSWSLLVEMFAAPFVLLFVLLRRKFGFFALILAACYATFAIDYPFLVGYLNNLWPYLLAFAVGVGVASPQISEIKFEVKPWHLAVAIFAFVFARHFVPRAGVSGLIAQTIIGGMVVYTAASVRRGLIHRFLVSAPVLFMGRISYSFYLINVPILYLVWGFMSKVYPLHVVAYPLIAGLGSAFISTAISIPISAFSEKYIERLGIRLGKLLTFWSTPARQFV